MSRADALLVIPEDVDELPAGAEADADAHAVEAIGMFCGLLGSVVGDLAMVTAAWLAAQAHRDAGHYDAADSTTLYLLLVARKL